MLSRIFIPPISGILAFLVIFFGWPMIVSEADIVARISSLLLDWSNRNFASMPPLLADYVAHASLASIAVTAAVLTTLAAIMLMLGWSLLKSAGGWILGRLRPGEVEEKREDLPPVEMNSTFVTRGDGKEVLGRGMDKLDRD